MSKNEKLSASLEDYLEAIHQIEKEKQAARAKDIVVRLGVTNASVTGALRALSAKGLVNYAPYDLVTLTSTGRRAAESVIRRHRALKKFLVDILGVTEAGANEAACRMEHSVSQDILDRLSLFVDYCQPDWLTGFQQVCQEQLKNIHQPPTP